MNNDDEAPAERWRRVERVYLSALGCTDVERAALLDDLCGGDDTLRRDVESMLRLEPEARSFLDSGAMAVAAEILRGEAGTDLIGQTLDGYTITGRLGAGGMGEVYRAHDSRLGRDVAIKVLPPELANDPDRLSRFDREARALAALNHPNIATIHGIAHRAEGAGAGPASTVRAIVLELVEGPTLAERLNRGALPLDEALAIARQIAEALDAAHEKGIVHRDLKPANIKIRPDGGVKVLDFGLAKLVNDVDRTVGFTGTEQLTVAATEPGLVIGTAPYMSPEQARGAHVDKRTDIWAFGCVLFEMLAGRPAFGGATTADTLASVLEREPDWKAMSPRTPPDVMSLVQRCLDKDVRHRLRDIGDSQRVLSGLADVTRSTPVAGLASTRRLITWTPWTIVAAGMILAFAFWPKPATPGFEFIVEAPESAAFVSSGSPAAMAPNGLRLVFVASKAGESRGLWLRDLSSSTPRALPRTEGATDPFWSPDSRSIAFFAQGKLKRLDLGSGLPVDICAALSGAGGTWNADGTIVFGTNSSALHRVAANAIGGMSEPVTKLDQGRSEFGHIYPHFLPDNRQFLYFNRPRPDTGAEVWVGSLDSPDVKRVLAGTSHAEYVEPGYLLFVRNGALTAQRFDTARLEVTGQAQVLATGLGANLGLGGQGPFSSSRSGALVYRAGPDAPTQLTWLDRSGRSLGVAGPPALYLFPVLSPDESRIAVEIADPDNARHAVWVLDSRTGSETRFKLGDNSHYPLWSPDSSRLLFIQGSELFEQPAGGPGHPSFLWKSQQPIFPLDWSSDRRFLIFSTFSTRAADQRDLWLLRLTASGAAPEPFAQTGSDEAYGRFSRDGKRIAYSASQYGRYEVYVQALPASGERSQVSSAGGRFPAWSDRELFYVSEDGDLMAVTIREGATFETAPPKRLFRLPEQTGNRASYSVSKDGQRFLVRAPAPGTIPAPLTVRLDWPSRLEAAPAIR